MIGQRSGWRVVLLYIRLYSSIPSMRTSRMRVYQGRWYRSQAFTSRLGSMPYRRGCCILLLHKVKCSKLSEPLGEAYAENTSEKRS
jgi:hypothetical protein